jgi:hypothetical protein
MRKTTRTLLGGMFFLLAAPLASSAKGPVRAPSAPSPHCDKTDRPQLLNNDRDWTIVLLPKSAPRDLRFGPFRIAAWHVYPAEEVGPFYGPPLRIWGVGVGASLWRDPITGRPVL